MTEPDEKRVDVEFCFTASTSLGMPATTSQEDIAESRRLNPQDESIEMNLEENDELVQPCAAPRMSPCRLRVRGPKGKRRKKRMVQGSCSARSDMSPLTAAWKTQRALSRYNVLPGRQ